MFPCLIESFIFSKFCLCSFSGCSKTDQSLEVSATIITIFFLLSPHFLSTFSKFIALNCVEYKRVSLCSVDRAVDFHEIVMLKSSAAEPLTN